MRIARLLALILCFCSRPALADGCFLPEASAKVKIPDQRAIIRFDRGVETLVIDTAFSGQGSNFAWIVPVPAVPKVQAVTTGTFPTLQQVSRPEMVHYVPNLWIGFTYFILWGFFLWWTRKYASLFILTFSVGSFAALLATGAMFARMGWASQDSGGDDSAVRVLHRKQVGNYETATLSAADGKALQRWLDQNGFRMPTDFSSTFQAYIKEGWVFVASHLRVDADPHGVYRAHPLALVFPTRRAVYPLRLTGIGNPKCLVDLYVFSDHRAHVPGFTVVRCSRVNFRGNGPAKLKIGHPELTSLLDGSTVMTKLSSVLRPKDMRGDAYVEWEDFKSKGEVVFSYFGASKLALNLFLPFLLVAAGFWFELRRNGSLKGIRLRKCCVVGMGASFLGFCLVFLILPKAKVIFDEDYASAYEQFAVDETLKEQARKELKANA